MAFQAPRTLLVLALVAIPASKLVAAPITADVAKACNILVDKKYPPAQPGNPAAGLLNGSVQDARAYFRKCVDNKGKVDDPPAAK